MDVAKLHSTQYHRYARIKVTNVALSIESLVAFCLHMPVAGAVFNACEGLP